MWKDNHGAGKNKVMSQKADNIPEMHCEKAEKGCIEQK